MEMESIFLNYQITLNLSFLLCELRPQDNNNKMILDIYRGCAHNRNSVFTGGVYTVNIQCS